MKVYTSPPSLHMDKGELFDDFDVARTRLFLFHLKVITIHRCQFHKEPYPDAKAIDIDLLDDISITNESIAMAVFPSTLKQLHERNKDYTFEKMFELSNIIHLISYKKLIAIGSCRSNVYAYLL
jgi:hypothetical protein